MKCCIIFDLKDCVVVTSHVRLRASYMCFTCKADEVAVIVPVRPLVTNVIQSCLDNTPTVTLLPGPSGANSLESLLLGNFCSFWLVTHTTLLARSCSFLFVYGRNFHDILVQSLRDVVSILRIILLYPPATLMVFGFKILQDSSRNNEVQPRFSWISKQIQNSTLATLCIAEFGFLEVVL